MEEGEIKLRKKGGFNNNDKNKKQGKKMDFSQAAFEDGWTSGGGENVRCGGGRCVQRTVKDGRTEGPRQQRQLEGKTNVLQAK